MSVTEAAKMFVGFLAAPVLDVAFIAYEKWCDWEDGKRDGL